MFASSIAKERFVADIRNQIVFGEVDVTMFERIAEIAHGWREDLRALAVDTTVAE